VEGAYLAPGLDAGAHDDLRFLVGRVQLTPSMVGRLAVQVDSGMRAPFPKAFPIHCSLLFVDRTPSG
jgi:hypothetical protein